MVPRTLPKLTPPLLHYAQYDAAADPHQDLSTMSNKDKKKTIFFFILNHFWATTIKYETNVVL